MDPEKGPYKRIIDAVKNAIPNSEIKIASGLYTDNIEITVPGLRLVPKDSDSEIIWVSYGGPAIRVNIPNEGKVYINNFKLAHTALRNSQDVSPESQDYIGKKEMILQAFEVEETDSKHVESDNPNLSYAKKLPKHSNMNCLLYVQNGKVEMHVLFSDLGLNTVTIFPAEKG